MSVTPNNLVAYGSANMPEADGVIVGGAVDFTINVAFYDISPSGTVDWVSSSAADTATKAQIAGRDTTGAIQTPAAITLNGRTPVTGSQTFERLLYGIITGAVAGSFPLANPGGTAALGDVACFAHAATISGHTAQAGSANSSGTTPPLFKLQAGDGASVSAGMIIRLTGGTDQYEIRQIVATSGYGTDVVAVNRDWTTVPDATTTYNVMRGCCFTVTPNAVTKVTRCFCYRSGRRHRPARPAISYEKVFVGQQQHRHCLDRDADRDRQRDAIAAVGRVARHWPLHRIERCQHLQPAAAGVVLCADRGRRVRHPAGADLGAEPRQPAFGRHAEHRRSARRVVAPDPAGRHRRLQGCRRPAGAGDDDVSSLAYQAGKALGAAPAK